jgi:molybdate transport system ATP-binding protein
MNLAADMQLQRGALALDVKLAVAAGETVALLGPNGAGKSTCLLALVGSLGLAAGRITLGGRILDDGTVRSFVLSARRRVGMVFQDGLLFPHLSVRDNVAYGLRSRGIARSSAAARADEWLQRVGLAGHGATHPAALSGGQRQRVALARALACEPELLLLDEPLAAVDATGRLLLRRELRAHLAAFPGPRLVVTHDLGDALALADRLVVLEGGRVVQSGRIDEIVVRPGSAYVADLIGINCFRGNCTDGVVRIGNAQLTVSSPLRGDVVVTVHPRAVSLFDERPHGSPRNVWSAPVVGVEAQLDRVRVQLGGPLPVVAEVTPAAVRELGLVPGREVWVAIKATEMVVAGL